MSRAGFAYAQARLHARMAERLTPADWQYLESSSDYGSCLDMISKTPAAIYVAHLGKSEDVHALEQVLREAWAELVDDVAQWVPAGWQRAVRWMMLLPHLRFPEARLGGQATPDWARRDRAFRGLWLDKETVSTTDKASWDLAALTPAQSAAGEVPALWLDEMESRLPRRVSMASFSLEMDQLFARFLGYNHNVERVANKGDRDLPVHLTGIFRKHAGSPAAVFAYLGLVALDFERLRAVLTLRLAFPHMKPDMVS